MEYSTTSYFAVTYYYRFEISTSKYIATFYLLYFHTQAVPSY